MYLQQVSYLFIISAFFVAIFKNKQIKYTTEKWFIYYLAFVIINEVIQAIQLIYLKTPIYVNMAVYDIVTFIFFIFWYSKVLKSKKNEIKILSFIYLLFLISSLLIENIFVGYLEINTYTGTIIILILVIMFYQSLLNIKQVTNYFKEPKFWISTGLLIFNIGYLPILFLLNLNFDKVVNVDVVMTTLNVILYGCFIKGFLCYQTKTN